MSGGSGSKNMLRMVSVAAVEGLVAAVAAACCATCKELHEKQHYGQVTGRCSGSSIPPMARFMPTEAASLLGPLTQAVVGSVLRGY